MQLMAKMSVPVAGVIRENSALLLTYGLSLPRIEALAERSLQGDFEQFRHTAFELTKQRAERACIELAVLVRYLHDEKAITLGTDQVHFGEVVYPDGKHEMLTLREVTNKIIHARAFTWDTSSPEVPMLICSPRDKQRWAEARINVLMLSIVCGSFEGA